MKEKEKKASPYLGMALLPFAILALELLVLLIGSLFYGTMDFTERIERGGVSAALIHWGCTCIAWAAGVLFLYKLAKKQGFDAFEIKLKAPIINWIIVIALLILSVVVSYLAWDMQFKPTAEFKGMIKLFENQAVFAFIGQYVYYIVESVLFLAIVALGQKFGELAFKKKRVPWGGLLCGITWGLIHILTQDLLTGIYAAFISIAYGFVYLLLKRNIRYTYPVITLMFIL